MNTMYQMMNIHLPEVKMDLDSRYDVVEKLKEIKAKGANLDHIRILRKLEDENEEYEVLRIRDMDINI